MKFHENYQHWTVKHRGPQPVIQNTCRFRIGIRPPARCCFCHEHYHYITEASNQLLYHHDKEYPPPPPKLQLLYNTICEKMSISIGRFFSAAMLADCPTLQPILKSSSQSGRRLLINQYWIHSSLFLCLFHQSNIKATKMCTRSREKHDGLASWPLLL